MPVIGILSDGVLSTPEGEVISRPAPAPAPEPRAVVVQQERTREPARRVAPMDALDEFNAHLAAALKLARTMSDSDKRRASNFMESARGVLTATTHLDSNEQRRFEAALRNA